MIAPSFNTVPKAIHCLYWWIPAVASLMSLNSQNIRLVHRSLIYWFPPKFVCSPGNIRSVSVPIHGRVQPASIILILWPCAESRMLQIVPKTKLVTEDLSASGQLLLSDESPYKLINWGISNIHSERLMFYVCFSHFDFWTSFRYRSNWFFRFSPFTLVYLLLFHLHQTVQVPPENGDHEDSLFFIWLPQKLDKFHWFFWCNCSSDYSDDCYGCITIFWRVAVVWLNNCILSYSWPSILLLNFFCILFYPTSCQVKFSLFFVPLWKKGGTSI